MAKPPNIFRSKCTLFVCTLYCLLGQVLADIDIYNTLMGVGYREQELQQAKGATFAAENPEGVFHVSQAGNTNIFIKGQHLNTNIQ